MVNKKRNAAHGYVCDLEGEYFCTIVIRCGKRTLLYVDTVYTKREIEDCLKIIPSINIEDSSCKVHITTTVSKFKRCGYGVYKIHLNNCKLLIIGHNNLNMIGKEIYG